MKVSCTNATSEILTMDAYFHPNVKDLCFMFLRTN